MYWLTDPLSVHSRVLQAKLEQVAEVVAQYEQELTSLGTIEHLQAERSEVLERLKKGKAEVHTIKVCIISTL